MKLRRPLALPQIRALILENTFLSLPRLVPFAMPFLGPFAFLCHQKWDSSKIPTIPAETPMLLLSSVQDEVVPREHMEELWELVRKRVPRGQRDVHAEQGDDGTKDVTSRTPGPVPAWPSSRGSWSSMRARTVSGLQCCRLWQ